MTRDTYVLLKRIMKNPYKTEKYYLDKYKCGEIFDIARADGYVSYFFDEEHDNPRVRIGLTDDQKKFADTWLITPAGKKAYYEYRDTVRTTWSGRRFSIIVALVGAFLSLLISIVVNVFIK